MLDILNAFHKKINKDEIAKLLKTNPAALQAFEDAYAKRPIDENANSIFDISAKQVAKANRALDVSTLETDTDAIVDRIVDELIAGTRVWKYDGCVSEKTLSIENKSDLVSKDEIQSLPTEVRPQLTGSLMKKDLGGPSSYIAVVNDYNLYNKSKDANKKKFYYHHFRQGLDILDLDPVLYEMLGMNKNAMGYWLPKIVPAITADNNLKIPKTTIIKVPLSMLQLTRLSYETLNRTTLDIVDKYCMKVFDLDETKDYFIKTGTYSSKFDFRNAHVHGAKEVRELGEYLLFIQNQATMMAEPLSSPCIYGVSTTNEWVVREFIADKENNPCIYEGLPLHTEYRLFVDFDTKEVIGMSPYWEPETMKKRFGHSDDSDTSRNTHDYIIYSMHEETLMRRYHENKDLVKSYVNDMIQNVDGLSGQWSIDIMQNGDEFWLIDMALAQDSALIECVPKEKRTRVEENWLPDLQNTNHSDS